MTAPTDAALVRDIELALDAGFNGARLHQKVFEERFLHHADRLGYLVWGEFGDWGCAVGGQTGDNQQPDASYTGQWLEAVERDYSHPSIIGWCPLNETYQRLHDRTTQLDAVTRAMFLATKALDTTRPVIDASGYAHRVAETDIYDSHSYEQDPVAFAAQVAGLDRDRPYVNASPDGRPWSLPYRGSRTSSASSAVSGGTRRPPRRRGATIARSPGGTANGPATRRSSTRGSPASPARCWMTRTCSATATRS